ncbi:benzoate transporter [Sphingomonas spermidinifaciens]|uniref:Benzoate transporter n=1 Tax=Sphingomonas spermidinifaciens TaxID=1141889 RepID=A0A2A4B4I3_9SPHN|nr:benzoate/H(+) symporter BenE family transporter [Sphingomonas spermidinifaciens]PCD02957.1 benzoate transporter [Sphingomonas spermidinifaciens]
MHRMPPPSAWISAFVAALVGFGGTVALVIQALHALGATGTQIGTALTALCLGIAIGSAVLSFQQRVPVILAWSTPGAALLAGMSGLSWSVATGAFVFAALVGIAFSLIPTLGRLAAAIPHAIAAAMLAGVLMPFCLALFRLGSVDPLLVASLALLFLVARQRIPVYALLVVLAAGILLAFVRGQVGGVAPGAVFGSLVPAPMEVDASVLASVGLPLFFVTLVSQNLPGLAVLRGAGYPARPTPLLLGTGLASLAAAPFGGHAVNLAAITAAICTNEEADPEPHRRWKTGLLYGGFYLLLAGFAPLLVRHFLALPPTLMAALTGIALLPPLGAAISSLATAAQDRDAAILTLLVTASGVSVFGLGSALWGIVAGLVALAVSRLLKRR